MKGFTIHKLIYFFLCIFITKPLKMYSKKVFFVSYLDSGHLGQAVEPVSSHSVRDHVSAICLILSQSDGGDS